MVSALPSPLQEAVEGVLRSLGDTTGIHSARLLGGGCINNAMRLVSEKSSYLLKWNADPLPEMFLCEARGLTLLAATHTVRVPQVYDAQDALGDRPAYILMEWLEGAPAVSQARLGEQLAELHRQGVSPRQPAAYGLGEDNYIGSTRQLNGWNTDWVVFFARHRLAPQLKLAAGQGRLPSERRSRLEQLIDRLPDLLGGVQRRPALIHGDLWGGNVIAGPAGLALIDPAVSYSDREADIAFSMLFGGFTASFYDAYQASWPLDPGFPDRRDLYNLYHLLNHLNLFGEGYGRQVDAVLRRYTS